MYKEAFLDPKTLSKAYRKFRVPLNEIGRAAQLISRVPAYSVGQGINAGIHAGKALSNVAGKVVPAGKAVGKYLINTGEKNLVKQL